MGRARSLTNRLRFATVAFLAAAQRSSAQNIPPDIQKAAEEKAVNLCSTCHGPRGISTSPNFPSLLRNARAIWRRRSTHSGRQTRAEKDAHDFMWGIAGQSRRGDHRRHCRLLCGSASRPGRSDDPALVAKGKELFDKGVPDRGIPACMTCHGANGEGDGRLSSPGRPACKIRGQATELHSVARPCGAGDARHRQGSDARRNPGRRGLRTIEVNPPHRHQTSLLAIEKRCDRNFQASCSNLCRF